MTQLTTLFKIGFAGSLSFLIFPLCIVSAQVTAAEGIFISKNKSQHNLTGVELNRIKAEHQIKFGSKESSAHFSTNNPWEKKKQKTQTAGKNSTWGDCRDYALHKRNRCYREGRDAYRCEQLYETRVTLCDSSL